MTPVRLWLHRLRFRRHASSHPLRDAWERWQALQEGLDFELDHGLPRHAEMVAINDNWETGR